MNLSIANYTKNYLMTISVNTFISEH